MTDLSLSLQSFAGRWRRLDRVWLTIGLLFLGLAALVPGQAVASLRFTADAFLWIAPFLLLSVLLAAWLKAAGADRLIGRSVAHAPATAILLAALFGSLSPFCSCGVVPLVAALLAAGLPLPAVMAFWVSSPLMDPETFVLMAATLGLSLTLAKTAAAIGIGLLAGFATLGLQRLSLFENPLRPRSGCGTCVAPATGDAELRWAFWREAPRRRAFADEAWTVCLFLSKWLLLAFAIESLMVVWLPGEVVAQSLGGEGWGVIPLAAVVGVPAYLNGFAAIPLIGELLSMGMAPGAALTFLVAGGVTSLPAAMAVFALVRRPVFLWYLTVALVGSLIAGFGYQATLAL